jgi:penicillin-binding protein 2
MALRIALLAGLAMAIFGALFFRLWALQVISGDRYLAEARDNQVRTFRIQAPRGVILDRNGEVLVANAPATSVVVWPTDLPAEGRDRVVARLSRLLGLPAGKVRRAIAEHEDDPLTPATIRTGVRPAQLKYLLEHQSDFPGVQVADTYVCRYERVIVAAQFLGYVAEISKEQLKHLGKDGYASGDLTGQTGVEAAYDEYLRGRAGIGRVRVDANGRVKSEREFRQVPEGGRSLRLTIDAFVFGSLIAMWPDACEQRRLARRFVEQEAAAQA